MQCSAFLLFRGLLSFIMYCTPLEKPKVDAQFLKAAGGNRLMQYEMKTVPKLDQSRKTTRVFLCEILEMKRLIWTRFRSTQSVEAIVNIFYMHLKWATRNVCMVTYISLQSHSCDLQPSFWHKSNLFQQYFFCFCFLDVLFSFYGLHPVAIQCIRTRF